MPAALAIREYSLHFPRRGPARLVAGQPLLLGVVNVTPDSFSDGGRFLSPELAVEHALALAGEGADWLDLGAESTRPGGGVYGAGAREVPAGEELDRLLPVLERLRPLVSLPISVDTRKAEVARVALAAGADLINDVSALGDPAMAAVVAAAGCPVILMHSRGELRSMQRDIRFDDVVREVRDELGAMRARAVAAGIARRRFCSIPGSASARRRSRTSACSPRPPSSLDLGAPIVVGASRKSFLGALTGAPARRAAAGEPRRGRASRPRRRRAAARARRRRDAGLPRRVAGQRPRRERRRDSARVSSSLLTWTDLVDIAVVTILLYNFLLLIRGTRAVQMLIGLLLVLGVQQAARFFSLRDARDDHPELPPLPALRDHRPLPARDPPRARQHGAQSALRPLDESADRVPAQRGRARRRRALGAQGRRADGLRAPGGAAQLRRERHQARRRALFELLVNLFTPDTPLHDGAVIVQGNRLLAAACFLPLATQAQLSSRTSARATARRSASARRPTPSRWSSRRRPARSRSPTAAGSSAASTPGSLRLALHRHLVTDRRAMPHPGAA